MWNRIFVLKEISLPRLETQEYMKESLSYIRPTASRHLGPYAGMVWTIRQPPCSVQWSDSRKSDFNIASLITIVNTKYRLLAMSARCQFVLRKSLQFYCFENRTIVLIGNLRGLYHKSVLKFRHKYIIIDWVGPKTAVLFSSCHHRGTLLYIKGLFISWDAICRTFWKRLLKHHCFRYTYIHILKMKWLDKSTHTLSL